MTAIAHWDDHEVVALSRWLEVDLAAAIERPMWSMSAKDAEQALLSLTRVRGQLDALLMKVLRQADAVGAGLDTGATSTTNWWSHATRTTRAEAHRMARLAGSLDEHGEVGQALASGDLRTDQARVITDAVADLPDEAAAWVPIEATRFLLQKAGEHDAKELRVLGRRLLEAVDPEAADAEEARRLEREERDAEAGASFSLTDDGHGTCHGRFTVPSLHGAMLMKELKARVARDLKTCTSPAGDGEHPRSRLGRHRLGRAFMDYVESRSVRPAPTSGGVAATVVVTMEIETLMGGIKAASLDTGGRISAGEARRLACRAGIIPVVLGGASVPLDVGRKRRFHTEAQRIAMALRDGGCTAAGCDAPAGMTEAHHDEVSWGQRRRHQRGEGSAVVLAPPPPHPRPGVPALPRQARQGALHQAHVRRGGRAYPGRAESSVSPTLVASPHPWGDRAPQARPARRPGSVNSGPTTSAGVARRAGPHIRPVEIRPVEVLPAQVRPRGPARLTSCSSKSSPSGSRS